MSDEINFGIVGFGAQGSMYSGFLDGGKIQGGRLAAIADTDPDKLAKAKALHPGAVMFPDHRAMIDSGAVDVVVTTLPHFHHIRVALDALDAGVHALLEKPAGIYASDLEHLLNEGEKKPAVTLALMLNQRYNPVFMKVKEAIDTGEFGTLRHCVWHATDWWRPQRYYDQSAWRATWGGEGGGVLVNQAPHQLDLWQWMVGMPERVTAKMNFGYRRDIAVEDDAFVLADFAGGGTGIFATATHDILGINRLQMLFDNGKIVVTGGKHASITRLNSPEQAISEGLTNEQVKQIFSTGFDPQEISTTEVFEESEPYGSEHVRVLNDFVSHLLQGTPLKVQARDGLNEVKLVNAIYLSQWEGRAVGLDEDAAPSFARHLRDSIDKEGRFDRIDPL